MNLEFVPEIFTLVANFFAWLAYRAKWKKDQERAVKKAVQEVGDDVQNWAQDDAQRITELENDMAIMKMLHEKELKAYELYERRRFKKIGQKRA
jgi:hypothetical protein